MTVETNNFGMPLPLDHATFETLCLNMAWYEIGDKNAYLYGRSGQNQHGVDICAQRDLHTRVAIQCKMRKSSTDTKMEKTFREDFEEALTVKPPFSEFIFMTTHPVSTKLQDFAVQLQQEQLDEGREIKVIYWGYEKIQEISMKHKPIMELMLSKFLSFDSSKEDKLKLDEEIYNANVTPSIDIVNSGFPLAGLKSFLRVDKSKFSDSSKEDKLKPDEEIYKTTVTPFIDIVNSGHPGVGLDNLLNIDESKFSDKNKAQLYAVIAHIYERIGDIENAKIFTRKSISIDDNQIRRKKRKAYSAYLEGNHQECVDITIQLLKEDMKDEEKRGLCTLHLASYAHVMSVDDDPLLHIPDHLKKCEEVCAGHVNMLNILKIPSHNLIQEYLSLHPDNLFLRLQSITSIISTIEHKGILYLRYIPPDSERNKLSDCLDKLKKLWGEVEKYEPDAIFPEILINLILVNYWLGHKDEAYRMINKSLNVFPKIKEFQYLCIEYLQVNGTIEEFQKYISNFSDKDTFRDIYLIEKYMKEGKISEATNLFEKIDIESLRHSDTHKGMFSVLAQLGWQNRNLDLARKFINEEKNINPNAIEPFLLEINLLEASNATEEDIQFIINEAMSKINDNSTIDQRHVLADFLKAKGLTSEAISLLHEKTPLKIASPALTLYLELLSQDDSKRYTFKNISDSISTDVHRELHTEYLLVNFFARIKDYAEAERYAKDISEIDDPPNFHNKLVYARILFRQQKILELGAYLSSLSPIPYSEDSSILYGFGYCNFVYGDTKEGLKQIYASTIKNLDNVDACTRYMGFIFSQGESILAHLPIERNKVEIGDAIRLKGEEQNKTWIIEDESDFRIGLEYIAPEDSLAKTLIGKNLGDHVSMNDENSKFEIVDIQHKEIHLHYKIQDMLWDRHGKIDGLEKIQLDQSLPIKTQMEPIVDRLREKNERINKCWTMYQNNYLTFRLFCAAINTNIADVYQALYSLDGNLNVCYGNKDERDLAFKYIKQNKKSGFVADLLTYKVIFDFGLIEIVKEVLGRAYITNYSKEENIKNAQAFSPSLNQVSGSMGYNASGYYFLEPSEEDVRNKIEAQESFTKFLNRMEYAIAIGSADIKGQYLDKNNPNFLDDALAASGKKCILLSEDMNYRYIASAEVLTIDGNLKSTWLQPVLMVAWNENIITIEQYHEFVWKLIENKHYFTSVTPEFLLYGSLKDNIDKQKLAKSLITTSNNLEAVVRVFIDYLYLLWNSAELTQMEKHNITKIFIDLWRSTRGEDEACAVCKRIADSLLPDIIKKSVDDCFSST